MQFERVATRHNPQTAAEVFALARVIRQRQLKGRAKNAVEYKSTIDAKARERVQEKARVDEYKQIAAPKYRLVVDIEAKGPAIYTAFEAVGCDAKKIRIEHIIHAACAHFNVSQTDMLSSRRDRAIVLPRQFAMYVARHVTLRSLPEIGRRFGDKDHTTVMHAVEKIERLLTDGDATATAHVALLKRALGVA